MTHGPHASRAPGSRSRLDIGASDRKSVPEPDLRAWELAHGSRGSVARLSRDPSAGVRCAGEVAGKKRRMYRGQPQPPGILRQRGQLRHPGRLGDSAPPPGHGA
ncbi:hypothetical protein H696_05861 [Fonticula alba]|uniref:Uncharacterized protein n=1 Tax=Fonticula alba TaxID=691883 RepID=A0A058Z256_FONAL|nr:hypothetical protein H696_05861 [Fonticula alba]KCV67597.1 hypothetical protein H696_05861 [Fonticula alba]|eukprot:XP_009497935.1 hypothetical protein H696_05861 [Fonticula alba]